jgi:hypothetical protein
MLACLEPRKPQKEYGCWMGLNWQDQSTFFGAEDRIAILIAGPNEQEELAPEWASFWKNRSDESISNKGRSGWMDATVVIALWPDSTSKGQDTRIGRFFNDGKYEISKENKSEKKGRRKYVFVGLGQVQTNDRTKKIYPGCRYCTNKQETSARRNIAVRCIFLVTCLCNTKQRAIGGRLVVVGTFLMCLLGR